jgi:hypothetical protein
MIKYFLAISLLTVLNPAFCQIKYDSLKIDSMEVEYKKIKEANVLAASNASIQHFVMKNEDNTYGYTIFIDGNMTYHQPNIPAVSGNKGFTKVEHADAVVKLAIQKIREGESPPTLSVEEVENIINNLKIK